MNLYTRIFSSFILSLLFAFHFNAQGPQASASKKYDESKRLTAESDRFAEQALQLRENARFTSGSGQVMLIEEAEALEKLAMNKSAEGQKLEFNEHVLEYTANETKLTVLEKNKSTNKHTMQIKYLKDKKTKNRKIAEDLYNEADVQPALALKIGSFQNANEKIIEAITQQRDLMLLLKNEIVAKK